MASDVLVKVGADSSGLEGTLAGLAESVLGWVGSINPVAAAVTGAIVGIGVAAFNASNEFNKSMANVATLIPNNTARINELKTAVQDMAIATAKGTEDISGGLYEVISTWGDTAETVKLLEINARAAAAGLATTEEAIKLTSAVTKGYGDTSAEAVQKAADLAFQTMNLGQTNFPELAASIGRVIPLAATLGVTQEELFAVMATTTGVTGNAAEVSTQLRGVLQSLMAPTKDMAGLIKDMGFASGEALLKQQGLKGAIDTVVQAAESTGTPLQKYMSSIEGQTLALTLAGNSSDKYKENLKAMGDVAGSVDTAFKEQTEGVNATGFAWEQLGTKLEVVAQQIGDVLAPVFGVIVDAIAWVIDGLVSLTDATTYTGDSFGWLKELAQPVVDLMMNDLAPILVDITAFVVGFSMALWDSLKPALSVVWEILKGLVGFLVDVFVVQWKIVTGIIEGFIDVLKMIPGVGDLFKKGMDAMTGAVKDSEKAAKDTEKATKDLTDSKKDLATTLDTKTTPAIKTTTAATKDKKEMADLAKKAAKELEDSEKDLADAYKKVQEPAIKDVTTALNDVKVAKENVKKAAENLETAQANLKAKLDNNKTSSKDLKAAMTDLENAKKNVKVAGDNLKTSQEGLNAAQKKAKEEADKVNEAYNKMQEAMGKLNMAIPESERLMVNWGDELKAITETMRSAQTEAFDVQKALEDLGVTPKEKLKTLADEAEANFIKIRDSGTSSATEIDLAQKAAAEAMIGYYKQAGIDVPPELQKTLDTLKGKYDDHKTQTVGVFDTMKGSIQQSITQLSTDLVKSLWEDPGSFGEKAKKTLITLGEQVTTAFITPATTALSGFINGVIADLLGGKGFGGMLDRVKELGGAITDVFSGASTAVSGAGGAATNAGSGAGSGGGAAAGSGLMGTLGAIGSIGSFVTGVIGNFQNARQETTLNAIEENTRFAAITLNGGGTGNGGGMIGLIEQIRNFTDGLNSAFQGWFHDALVSLMGTVESLPEKIDAVNNWLQPAFASLMTTTENILEASMKTVSSMDQLNYGLQSVSTQLDRMASNPPVVNNTVNVKIGERELYAIIEEVVDMRYGMANL